MIGQAYLREFDFLNKLTLVTDEAGLSKTYTSYMCEYNYILKISLW